MSCRFQSNRIYQFSSIHHLMYTICGILARTPGMRLLCIHIGHNSPSNCTQTDDRASQAYGPTGIIITRTSVRASFCRTSLIRIAASLRLSSVGVGIFERRFIDHCLVARGRIISLAYGLRGAGDLVLVCSVAAGYIVTCCSRGPRQSSEFCSSFMMLRSRISGHDDRTIVLRMDRNGGLVCTEIALYRQIWRYHQEDEFTSLQDVECPPRQDERRGLIDNFRC
jgi:hypothetical protein